MRAHADLEIVKGIDDGGVLGETLIMRDSTLAIAGHRLSGSKRYVGAKRRTLFLNKGHQRNLDFHFVS